MVALLITGYGAVRATLDARAVDVLPAAVAERLAANAQWQLVADPPDDARACGEWQLELARSPVCARRVGAVALTWHWAYFGGGDAGVQVTLDESVQRHFPDAPEDRICDGSFGACGALRRERSAIQHAHVQSARADLVRCTTGSDGGEIHSCVVAVTARPRRWPWATAIVLTWCALVCGSVRLLARRRDRTAWQVARRTSDGRWRLDDGTVVAISGVEGAEALVVMGPPVGATSYRTDGQLPERVMTAALLSAAEQLETARRGASAAGWACISATAALLAWCIR